MAAQESLLFLDECVILDCSTDRRRNVVRKQTGLLFLIIAVATLTVTGPAFSATETPPMLTMAKQKLAMEFDRLDSGLKQAGTDTGVDRSGW